MAYIGQPVSTLVTIPNTGVTAGNYGSSTIVPVITVNADGRISYIANVAVSGGGGGGTTISITNDTTTNSDTFYPLLSNNVTSGTLSTANTSNTKLYYNANLS